MSLTKHNGVYEVDAIFTEMHELDKLIKILRAEPYVTVTTSLKKFQQVPYQYDYWYSKSKMLVKIANKDGKIFSLIDRLLKIYDKISDV